MCKENKTAEGKNLSDYVKVQERNKWTCAHCEYPRMRVKQLSRLVNK